MRADANQSPPKGRFGHDALETGFHCRAPRVAQPPRRRVVAHGSGNPEPDIPLDLLDPRAHIVLKDVPFEPDIDLLEGTKYDAVALVGMHAKTGSRGFASHTITIGIEVLLNGKSVSESEWFGYSWGRIGVPVIFDAGDDRLQADIAPTMPWVRFVVTKKATSVSTVELLPVDQVHAEMTAKAKDAITHLSEMKVMKIAIPIRTTLHAVPPATLVMLKDVPGLDYNDSAVTFMAADFPAAYKGLMGLLRVATGGYTSVMNETLRASGTAPQITAAYREALFNRWADFGSGRWTPPPPAAREPGRKYHGSN